MIRFSALMCGFLFASQAFAEVKYRWDIAECKDGQIFGDAIYVWRGDENGVAKIMVTEVVNTTAGRTVSETALQNLKYVDENEDELFVSGFLGTRSFKLVVDSNQSFVEVNGKRKSDWNCEHTTYLDER